MQVKVHLEKGYSNIHANGGGGEIQQKQCYIRVLKWFMPILNFAEYYCQDYCHRRKAAISEITQCHFHYSA